MKTTEDQTARTMWSAACEQIKGEVSKPMYQQWFAPVRPLRYAESEKHNTFVLGVANDFFASWFSENFGGTLARILKTMAGKPVKLAYENVEIAEEIVKAETRAVEHTPALAPASVIVPEGCDPKYTFKNFVVGSENQLAYFAALKAAQNPGLYSPLFIYGDTALGKTHLLHAIANEYANLHPNAVVKYATLEELLNDYTHSVTTGKYYEFRHRYRDVDILLVDDVQFLANKENLQVEFFNTFNALHKDGRQIVLTSDRRPSEINGLEDRLVSRFESGMTAEVLSPNFETRLAVLRHYRDVYCLTVEDDVLQFIAQRITTNMRRLIGAMMKILIHEQVYHVAPDIVTIETTMPDLFITDRSSRRLAVGEIQRKVSDHFNVKLTDLLGSRRTKNLSFPRHVAMYLCRKLTPMSFPDIAEAFGGKNHATVIHACKRVEEAIRDDADMRIAVGLLERNLKD